MCRRGAMKWKRKLLRWGLDDVADTDSPSASWGKLLLDSNSSKTYACEGRRHPPESKEGLFFSLSLSISQVSLRKQDTLLSWPLSAHRTRSQVSFPFMPTMAWSPPKLHIPLQAQKAAHSACSDSLRRGSGEAGCWIRHSGRDDATHERGIIEGGEARILEGRRMWGKRKRESVLCSIQVG